MFDRIIKMFIAASLVVVPLAGAAKDYIVKSPSGNLVLKVATGKNLTWQVNFKGHEITAPSVLSVKLKNGGEWGSDNPGGKQGKVSRTIDGVNYRKAKIEDMDPYVLLSVRTWDGKGEDLNNPEDPAWFECVTWPKTVIFGHWAAKGLVDNVPGFIGLDSGCVYGKYLSAYCLEERKFYSVPAARPYSPIKKKKRVPANA